MLPRILFHFLFLLFCFGAAAQSPQGSPEYLRCEYLTAPLGIDNPQPRFTWRISDNRDGALCKGWQLWVGSDSAAVAEGKGNMWDSGKQKQFALPVVYAGKPLTPRTRYYWRVRSTDQTGKAHLSEVAPFEMGMMQTGKWQGNWIGDNRDINYKPAPYFRKEFSADKPVKQARAYVAAAGLFELYLNGEKVGNHHMDPMYTRFDRRNLYVTFDVTAQLQEGKNAVGVLLGNGWYNHQSMGVWNFHNAPWRNRPTFCLDLYITYTDGTTEVVKSDRDWKTGGGGLRFNSIYTAEHYDFRLEQADWCRPGFNDARWQGAGYRGAPSPQVVSQQMHPIRKTESFTAKSFKQLNDTSWLYDFGQNMSGVSRLRVKGPEGRVLRLIHSERILPNGHADLTNINVYHRPVDNSDPFQTDIVTLSGKGEEEFTARFNYKGFRYVEVVSDGPVALSSENLTAYFVHSDVPKAGFVASSSGLINNLWKATNYAYLSNLQGYPTDCPQREKNGWTGDAHLAIETALYNFDGITVYEKWLADHRDEQQPNGVLPDIIPTGGWGYGTENGLDWTSTIAIIPWNLYLFYGDSKCLADCYPYIKRYVDYVDRRSPEGLTSWGRGDWVPVRSRSVLELTSSVYFYADADILAKAATLFGKEEDALHYRALADKIKNAINQKYLNRETGIYASGTQTELSVPLLWGVVPPESVSAVAGNLAKKVEETGFHLDVGVLGAKAILNALDQNGYPEHAYKVAVQDSYPSWGWWIVNGATTLLENWDVKASRDISDNHMMFGEIGGWFFKGLGGIRPDPAQPGFRNILLTPYFPKDLPSFEAVHQSPYGTIRSAWERKENAILYTITLPPHTTALLTLPKEVKGKERTLSLSSGTHQLTLNL